MADVTITSGARGVLCGGCGVLNPTRIIDSDLTNAGRMVTLLGTAAEVYARASHNTNTTYTGVKRVGVVVSSPDSRLDLSLLGQIRIRTFNDGTVRETFGLGTLVNLQLVTLFNDPSRFMLIVNTSSNFDAVEIGQSAVVGALGSLDVYAMCVALAGS